MADEYASHGWTAVVQDVVLGDDLSAYAGRVRTRPLYVVVLAPSAAAVRAREAGRPKTGYGVWTVEAPDDVLRTATPRVGFWLDTGEPAPEQTVTTILDNLPAARVEAADGG